MNRIDYRVLTEASVEAVVRLYQAGGWWQESPTAREVIPRMMEGSFCFLGAFSSGGEMVGMGRAISDGASDAYIQDVVVLPEFRGMGIGRELVRRLAEYCRGRGIEWIGLVAEPGTAAFYESLGFQPLENYQPMLFRKTTP